jgi:hypothetical protein
MPKRKKKLHHLHVRDEFWLVFAIVLGVMFGFCAALILYSSMFSPSDSVFVRSSSTKSNAKTISRSEAARVQLIGDMRQLWNQDAMWTRQYISAFIAGTGDYDEALNRLQQNNDAMVAKLASYYGSDVEPTFGVELKQRTTLLSDYLASAKKNDKGAMAEAEASWQTNASVIGNRLSNLGMAAQGAPDFGAYLLAYEQSMTQEIKARIAKKWSDDAAAAIAIDSTVVSIADEISGAIIAQFPAKF